MPGVIRYEETVGPQSATRPAVDRTGAEMAAQGAKVNQDFSQLAAALYQAGRREDEQAYQTQKAHETARAIEDADGVYFKTLDKLSDLKARIADGQLDWSEYKTQADTIIETAKKEKRVQRGPSSQEASDIFENQVGERLRPVRTNVITEWTERAVKRSVDTLHTQADEFEKNTSRLTGEDGMPVTVGVMQDLYIGLQERTGSLIRGQVITREAGQKLLQESLISALASRHTRLLDEDPEYGEIRFQEESKVMWQHLDATYEKGFVEKNKERLEQYYVTRMQVGGAGLDETLEEARAKGLDPRKLVEAYTQITRTRNDLVDVASHRRSKDLEEFSKYLSDAGELRAMKEVGFNMTQYVRDNFHFLRHEERERLLKFDREIKQADANVVSDTRTMARLLTAVYDTPEGAENGILAAAASKQISKGDAEELLKKRLEHVEKLKDKKVQQTHAQYVAAIHDLEERMRTVGGGSTEVDPIAIEVKDKWVSLFRRVMFDPESTSTAGDDLQDSIDRLKEKAVEELKQRTAQAGLQVVQTRRLYDAEGKPSAKALAEALRQGLVSNLEAKRARDYIDLKNSGSTDLKVKVEPRVMKKPSRTFQRTDK